MCFYSSNGLNDGTTKNPRLQTLQRDTMVTNRACQDYPGVTNETVPFLVPTSYSQAHFERLHQHFWALRGQAISERRVVTPRSSSERVLYVPVQRGHPSFYSNNVFYEAVDVLRFWLLGFRNCSIGRGERGGEVWRG